MPDPTRIADQYDGFRVCYRYLPTERADEPLETLPFRVASRPFATKGEAVATAENWLADVTGLWDAVELAVRVGREGEVVWRKAHRTRDFTNQPTKPASNETPNNRDQRRGGIRAN